MKVNKKRVIIFKLNFDDCSIVNLQKWSTWLDSNQRYSSAQVRRPRSDWPTGRHIKIKPKLEREAGFKPATSCLEGKYSIN